MRKRRINFHGLAGFLDLLLGRLVLHRPHIVKAVRQLDYDDADILRHGDEHLPKILCLNLNLILGIIELCQLCHAVHKKRDLRAEQAGKLGLGDGRILDDIVEDARHNRLLVHLQLRQNDSHRKRMDDVRLAALSLLVSVGIQSKAVRPFDDGEIRRRTIKPYRLNQFVVQLLRIRKILCHADARVRFIRGIPLVKYFRYHLLVFHNGPSFPP